MSAWTARGLALASALLVLAASALSFEAPAVPTGKVMLTVSGKLAGAIPTNATNPANPVEIGRAHV